MDYRRIWQNGGTYFFTVNLLQRKNNALLTNNIQILRESVQKVKHKYPFKIHAWVVLPDHLHCIWELPDGDADYASRWRLIKSHFSRRLDKIELISNVQLKRNERGIWQRRYWAHLITDQHDFNAHMDYVHINPLKHGFVNQVKDWEYSTFHHHVELGIYPPDWSGSLPKLNYED